MTLDEKIVEAVARAIASRRDAWKPGERVAHDYVADARAAITAYQAELEKERQEKLNEKCRREGFDSKVEWVREYRARTGAPLRLALEAYEANQPLPPAPKASP